MSKREIPPPETPSVQTEVPPPPKRRFGKKLYLAIGIVAIVAIILVLVFAFFNPLGQGARVGLNVAYEEGEIMTYNVTMSYTGNFPGMTVGSQSATISLQVLDFDGDNYTMSATMSAAPGQSFTFKINKNGYIADISQLPPEVLQMYAQIGGFPGILSPLPKQSVTIGETVSTPLNMNLSGPIVTGTMNWKFSEMANVTVPAGTYNTFKIDVTSKDVQATISGIATATVSISGSMHFENATCRFVDLNVQATITMSAGLQSASATFTAQAQLIQDFKP